MHLVGSVRIDEVAVQISSHRGECGASGGKAIEIFISPAPDFGREAEVGDSTDLLQDRPVDVHHLGANSGFETARAPYSRCDFRPNQHQKTIKNT